jgi:hypothetical protein
LLEGINRKQVSWRKDIQHAYKVVVQIFNRLKQQPQPEKKKKINYGIYIRDSENNKDPIT